MRSLLAWLGVVAMTVRFASLLKASQAQPLRVTAETGRWKGGLTVGQRRTAQRPQRGRLGSSFSS